MIFKSMFLIFSSVLMYRTGFAMLSTHIKCRGGIYPRSTVERFPVPDDKVSWSSEYKEYNPPEFTSPSIHGKPWADPNIEDKSFKPIWNSLNGAVERTSYTGQYEIVKGFPLNPVGRTGIKGRGVLGRWGPNHAADSVVTRWKILENGAKALDADNKPILQFISIKRSDSGEWALPGGMVDPGEKVAAAAVREFEEEAMNSFKLTDDQKESLRLRFKEFFSIGQEIYRGYVDDRRNTDNAWMETIGYNFHDENGTVVDNLNLHAGDDAVGVSWLDVTPDLKLYANHGDIVKAALKKRVG